MKFLEMNQFIYQENCHKKKFVYIVGLQFMESNMWKELLGNLTKYFQEPGICFGKKLV